MLTKIDHFAGEHRYLSNFFPAIVWLDGDVYVTVEHAYHAAKTLDREWRRKIQQADKPGEAKRLGRKAPLRAGWDEMKLDVMLGLLRQKFDRHPDLRASLTGTGDAEIVEGNTWRDCYWGVCNGAGENHLGRLLMQVRSEIGDGLDL